MTTEEGTPEWQAQVIASTVLQKGVCIFHSDVLGERVAFIRDHRFQRVIPKDVVAYTDAELRELFAEGKPYVTPNALKLIHETKRQGGEVSGYQEKLM